MKILNNLQQRTSQDRLDALADLIPYAKFLGMTAEDRDGVVVTHLPFKTSLIGNRNLPAVHGGVLGAFLELTSVIQILHDSAYAQLPKTIDISIEYLRSAGPSDMYARAYITRHGRRVANVRAEMWQQDPDRLITIAHGHYLLKPL
ncbi:MAG: PaaI family thioesterase [Pseudomonadales bacterium]